MADVNISAANISAIRLVEQAHHPSAPTSPGKLLYCLENGNTYTRRYDGTIEQVDASGGAGGTAVRCQIERQTAQTATAGVWTWLDFTSAVQQTGQYDFDTDIFTADQAGLYLVHVYGHVAGGANKFGHQCRVNDVVVSEQTPLQGAATPHHHLQMSVIPMAVDDELKIYAQQTTGTQFEGSSSYPMRLTIWLLSY